jgi:hypothetical protein
MTTSILKETTKRIKGGEIIAHQNPPSDWEQVEVVQVYLPLAGIKAHVFTTLRNFRFIEHVPEAQTEYKGKAVFFRQMSILPDYVPVDPKTGKAFKMAMPELELAILESNGFRKPNGGTVKLEGKGLLDSTLAMGAVAVGYQMPFDPEYYTPTRELKEMMIAAYCKTFQCAKDKAIAKAKEFLIKEIQND